MAVQFPLNVPNGLFNNFAEQFGGGAQSHFSFFNPGGIQKVFYEINEPHGVVVNIGINLLFCLFIKIISIAHQIACISGNRGEWCAQIVGNCAEHIGAELFAFCEDCRGLFFTEIFLIFKSECCFSENGKQNAVGRSIQGRVFCLDSDDSVNPFIHAKSKIEILGV